MWRVQLRMESRRFFPQVGDLLGDAGQIQRQVRPATCEAPQFLGLKLRPGVEVVLIQIDS
jgi:hypothetical protein